ncbi:hypothetical protein [Hymenobacter guriensis]|uniref:J domain-containing protein n=1 Tax=Hymenobacter guriensis TaxID=2793065 RepID=A0ABS0KX18_9BACT|nr:hypothetical protein [Hymenobacter guriensis]MBG8552315.1 hypothetical protein [Hymenobacter guriensis]
MKQAKEPTYRERYAAHLLRWAKIKDAIPEQYSSAVLDRLFQRGVYGVTKPQLQRFRNEGTMPDNPAVLEVFEEMAQQYHPDKIRSDKAARAFLRTWEQRPGRRAKAALLAAA